MTPNQPKIVTFAEGGLNNRSPVVTVIDMGARQGIVTASTPFHPIDYQWPDQPADRGMLKINDQTLVVVDCICGACSLDTGEYFTGNSIPVKKGAEGWDFFVVHVLESDIPIKEGQVADIQVDTSYRHSLNTGHTACHLSALALNQVLSGYWKKDPGRHDAMGSPDFDQLAIQTSRIIENGSNDFYRLGKSIRKKGLRAADVMEALVDIEEETNRIMMEWLETGATIKMVKEGEELLSRRYWHCNFADGKKVVIPCGGTHVQNLNVFEAIGVTLIPVDEWTFRSETRAIVAA
ncbi:alanyl-tRNA editing protein [Spongorhabdus nitratireducens]